MKAGWYIINYHNVDWEDSLLTRGLGGTVRPDVFTAHLRQLSAMGDLISVEDGCWRLRTGRKFSRPAFSLWFDDGFAGVRRHALPICQQFGLRAAVAINSRFVLRQELYWSCKLSFLAMTGGLSLLRQRLRCIVKDLPSLLCQWSLGHCTDDVLTAVDDTFAECTTPHFRQDAFRIFETVDGLKELAAAGWLISNHTAAHYPIASNRSWNVVVAERDECETLTRSFDQKESFFVIPYEWGPPRRFADEHIEDLKHFGVVVRAIRGFNTPETFASGVLHRYPAQTSYDIRDTVGIR